MRNYSKEIEPIKDAEYETFEFEIFKINAKGEWKKIRTAKIRDYKDFNCSNSSGCDLYNRKNGKKLDLCTVEFYDISTNPPEEFIWALDKERAYKSNYITLSTLNTFFRFYYDNKF